MESNAQNKRKKITNVVFISLILAISSLVFVLLVSNREATTYTYQRLFDKSALEPKQNYPDYKVLQRESIYSKQTIVGQVSKIIEEDDDYRFILSAPGEEDLDILIPNNAEIEIRKQSCLNGECGTINKLTRNIFDGYAQNATFVNEINDLELISLADLKPNDYLFIIITKKLDTGENDYLPSYQIIARTLFND